MVFKWPRNICALVRASSKISASHKCAISRSLCTVVADIYIDIMYVDDVEFGVLTGITLIKGNKTNCQTCLNSTK